MKILGNTINLRLINIDDAEFVLSLRLTSDYNQFLSKVEDDIEAQREWINNYKIDEQLKKQFYFIIEKSDGTPCGTVRVYDFKTDSFSWGSWILNSNKTRTSAIESALLVYEFGFNNLNFKKCHFEVMKENKSVITFHKKFGAKMVNEDNNNYFFEITPENIQKMKVKFSKK